MLLLGSIIVVAIVIGLLSRGRLSNLGRMELKGLWMAPLALILQFAPVPATDGAWLALAVLGLSYLLLVVFLLRNIRLGGAWIMLVGIALNILVIGANQGMPVSVHAIVASGQAAEISSLVDNEEGLKHGVLDDETLLPFLADVIPIGAPIHLVVSVGDLVFYAGIAWFIIAAMRKPRDEPSGTTPEEEGRSPEPEPDPDPFASTSS